MSMKKLLTLLMLVFMTTAASKAATPILGTPVASTDRMYQYIKSVGCGSSFTYEIAQNFHDIGAKWGVRGDIAICQSCIETGWFKYTGGTAVTPSDHNYCGLGVTTTGYKGCQFSTIFEGVTAQLQHLWSYATTAALPSGWTLVDPRFAHGRRGYAPNWENLGSGNWASAYGYGSSILSVYNSMMAFQMANPKITLSETDITISVQQNAVSPTKTITVKGENLGSAIQMVSNTSVLKYNTSGWSDYTGGQLLITVDTSKAVGTYSGGYIRVYSGDTSEKINVTVEILGPPTINVNPTSLNFTATQGDAAQTQTIKVTGSSLDRDISYASNSSVFTVAPGSNWNARTGGDLIVTLDTSKAPGTYEGYIAVQTTSDLRKEVPVKAVINAVAAPEPKITANATSVSLSAKQNGAAPTTSVTISAANLTRDMSFNASTSAFTVQAMPNWNARTGGTLNVTLNTDRAPGSYNGILAVVADTRLEISLNGTITDDSGVAPANPQLSVNPGSISLNAKQGNGNPTANVTVQASDQSSDIQYSVSGSGFSVNPAAGWNARTGGTLVVTFDANYAPGNYNGNLAVSTNDNQANVSLAATIEANQQPTVIPALSFQEIWNNSEKKNGSFAEGYRNFDYADGKLYCVVASNTVANAKIDVLDARTGQLLKTLNNGDAVVASTLALCDVAVVNGKIYASGLSTTSKDVNVYVWDNDDAAARVFMTVTVPTDVARLGDCLSVVDNGDNSYWVSFANDNNTMAKIVEYKVSASGVEQKITNATKADGATSLGFNSSARVRRLANGYSIDGKNILPSVLNSNGVLQYSLGTESCVWGNDFATFDYDGKNYMMVATYLNQSATTYAEGIMRLYDVTNGWENAVAVGDYPSNGLGSTRNTNTVGSLRVNKPNDGCVEAWILTGVQGIAYYRSGDVGNAPVTPPAPTPVLAVSETAKEFTATVGSSATASIYVSGQDLKGNINLSVEGYEASSFSVNPSSLSGSGNVTITFNPKWTGTHTATIFVTSQDAADVLVTLTGYAQEQQPAVTYADEVGNLEQKWLYSVAQGNLGQADWFSSANLYTRHMAVKGDDLYVLNGGTYGNKPTIMIIDANNGTKKGELSGDATTTGGQLGVANAIGFIGNDLYMVNCITGTTHNFRIYKYTNGQGEPALVLDKAGVVAGARSAGFGANKIGVSNGVKVWYVDVNDIQNIREITFDEKITEGDGGFGYEVTFMEDGTFWLNHKSTMPRHYNANGQLIETLGAVNGIVSQGSSVSVFDYGKHKYLAATSVVVNNVWDNGHMTLVDITNGAANPVHKSTQPETFGTGAYGGPVHGQTKVLTQLSGNNNSMLKMWALVPLQGIGHWTFNGENKSGVTGLFVDTDNQDAQAEYYNLQGIRVADDNLAPGIYICRKGNKTTKVMVR